MKRFVQLALVAALAVGVSACAGDRAPGADENANASRDATVGTSGTMTGDREFVQEQLAMGQAEIELGELAQQRASHPDVKQFAQMMVSDHRAAGEQLRQAARDLDENRPTGTSGESRPADKRDEPAATSADRGELRAHGDHAEVREELSKLSGRELDRRYIDRMVEDHEKAISDLETRAERADDPQVREWANTTLPKIRQHLEQAKQIQEKLERSGDADGQKKRMY